MIGDEIDHLKLTFYILNRLDLFSGILTGLPGFPLSDINPKMHSEMVMMDDKPPAIISPHNEPKAVQEADNKINCDVEHPTHRPILFLFSSFVSRPALARRIYLLFLNITLWHIPSKMTTRTTTVVSSPGKVLIAGGYLVLDTHYSGLVIGTSSRFYSCVSSRATSGTSDIDHNTDTDTCQDEAIISVRAGQFPSDTSTWVYSISKPSVSASASAGEDGGDRNPYLKLEQTNEEQAGKNKFIFITLCKVLEYVFESILAKVGDEETALDELMKRIKGGGFGGDGLEVVVFANNDFYSQREQVRINFSFFFNANID